MVNNPTVDENVWLDHQKTVRQDQLVAAVGQRGSSRTMAETGQRAPLRGV